jgi:DNA mismatch repair protein MutS2
MYDKKHRTDIPSANELRLRHLTLDEALPRLDQYLHDAYMSGLIQVKIIHGKGTGTLRITVRRVKSFRPGGYGEGGEGVTIVEMADK